MGNLLVVCDNTMGIPGGEIDDGLALLYLLGNEAAPTIEAICCTHGNAPTAATYSATKRLVSELGLDIPVLRGLEGPASVYGAPGIAFGARFASGQMAPLDRLACSGSTDAAEYLVKAANAGECALLSLGATSDLAFAERLAPGCLASFSKISLMGGLTGSLVVGERIMDELNFSIDAAATYTLLRTAVQDGGQGGARLLIADAQDCLPLVFRAADVEHRLASRGPLAEKIVRHYLQPWFKHAAQAWGIQGFVAWDVLAAVALARPDLVELVPYDVSINDRFLSVGLLAEAHEGPCARVQLVRVKDSQALIEHIFECWERAVSKLEEKSKPEAVSK